MGSRSIRPPRIWLWPLGGGLLGILTAWFAPPALWVCFVGAILLAAATRLNPRRPDALRDLPWRRGALIRFNRLETTLCLTGAALVAAPFVVMLVRSQMY
jgi:hypothetical protein